MTAVTLNTIQFGAKRISLAARIAHFIKLFAKSPSDWISERIAANIVRDTKFIEDQMLLIKQMDDKQAEKGMAFIRSILPDLEKMHQIVEKIDNPALSTAFRRHEFTIFKFEAKLHLKQTEHLPVIPNDPLLREAIFNAAMVTISSKL